MPTKKTQPQAPRRRSNVKRVEEELEKFPDVPPGLAGVALTLARGLDAQKPSLAMKSMASQQLVSVLDRIRELAPPEEKPDGVTDIERQRAKRRARLAAASD